MRYQRPAVGDVVLFGESSVVVRDESDHLRVQRLWDREVDREDMRIRIIPKTIIDQHAHLPVPMVERYVARQDGNYWEVIDSGNEDALVASFWRQRHPEAQRAAEREAQMLNEEA